MTAAGSRGTQRYKICIDCGALHNSGLRCMPCYQKFACLRPRAVTTACSCGGRKHPEAIVCAACRIAMRHASRLPARKRKRSPQPRWYEMPVPETCDCGFGSRPSPTHCACTRWKPADDALCEVCSAA